MLTNAKSNIESSERPRQCNKTLRPHTVKPLKNELLVLVFLFLANSPSSREGGSIQRVELENHCLLAGTSAEKKALRLDYLGGKKEERQRGFSSVHRKVPIPLSPLAGSEEGRGFPTPPPPFFRLLRNNPHSFLRPEERGKGELARSFEEKRKSDWGEGGTDRSRPHGSEIKNRSRKQEEEAPLYSVLTSIEKGSLICTTEHLATR